MRKSNLFNIEGKKVIVAGGSGLIGSALVKAFKESACEVINADIRGGDVYFNMSDPATILRALVSCPHIFVNAVYPRDFKTHSQGWLETTQHVIDCMVDEGISGSIVNFSSIYGIKAPDFSLYEDVGMAIPYAEYAMAKAGIIQMTKFLAARYGKYGIRVNAISPGGVWNNQHQRFVKRYSEKVPLGRMAEVDSLIGPIIFLASDASCYITGINLMVDGGLICKI